MNLNALFHREKHRHISMVEGHVVADPNLCIQCGMCSFYCPLRFDVRRFVWLGQEIADSRCLNCGECVAHCTRGALRLERTRLYK